VPLDEEEEEEAAVLFLSGFIAGNNRTSLTAEDNAERRERNSEYARQYRRRERATEVSMGATCGRERECGTGGGWMRSRTQTWGLAELQEKKKNKNKNILLT
jgi:hypothetical protein